MKSTRIRIVGTIALGLLFAGALFTRYSSDAVGCPGGGWDCGSHLSIINSLSRGEIFPLVKSHPLDTGHQQLLYSGILGSHLIALALHHLGTGIPRAMQVTLDLSLLLSLVVFSFVLSSTLKRQSPLAWGLFLALFLPAFCYISAQGFFSLAVSVPFVLLAIHLLVKRNVWLGFAASLGACFVYPDSAMWLLPFCGVIAFRSQADISIRILSSVTAVAGLSFFSVYLAREITKDGAIYLNATSFLVLPAFFFLTFIPVRRPFAAWLKGLPDEALLALLAVVSISLWSVISYMKTGTLKYYALKQYLWAPIICCFVVPHLVKASRLRAWLALFLALSPLWLLSVSSRIFTGYYAESKAAFSARDEEKVLSLLQTPPCPHFIVVGDRAGRGFNNGATFFLSANSYFASMSPGSTIVQLKNGTSFDFVRFLDRYWSYAGNPPKKFRTSDGTELCLVDLDLS